MKTAFKHIDEQFDMMEREETINTRAGPKIGDS
jgi:hypothetical protein